MTTSKEPLTILPVEEPKFHVDLSPNNVMWQTVLTDTMGNARQAAKLMLSEQAHNGMRFARVRPVVVDRFYYTADVQVAEEMIN